MNLDLDKIYLFFGSNIRLGLIVIGDMAWANQCSYTRRQINQDRMIFSDFSVNSEPIFLKFRKGHFLLKS